MLLALQLGDLELEMGNDRVAIGELRMRGCNFRALLQQQRLERVDIVRKVCFALIHGQRESQKKRLEAPLNASSQRFMVLTCSLGSPGVLRITPVDPFEHVR